MQLDSTLRICLLSLDSRYPENKIDLNDLVLGPHYGPAERWHLNAIETINLLQKIEPVLLNAPARLLVDSHRSEVYLVERSMKEPAIHISLSGRVSGFLVWEESSHPQISH